MSGEQDVVGGEADADAEEEEEEGKRRRLTAASPPWRVSVKAVWLAVMAIHSPGAKRA